MKKRYDTSAPADENAGLFGLDTDPDAAAIHVLSVPFDATASFGVGASLGPESILGASRQVELFHAAAGDFWERGLVLMRHDSEIDDWNREAREQAKAARAPGEQATAAIAAVNRISRCVDDRVRQHARCSLDDGRLVGLLGGDHSTALGLIEEVANRHDDLGVLWFDAHHDLREAYEGFERSHASILFNVLERCPAVTRVVQVGIRDFCEEEVRRVADSNGRVVVHTDESIARDDMQGIRFADRIEAIIGALPQAVHISLDIDGLDPSLCPGTGTPVPGGLSYNQAIALIRAVVESGRRVVSFDLVEVGPNASSPINEVVGARILFELCAQLSLSSETPTPSND